MTNFSDLYNKYFKDVYRYILSLSQNEVIAEEIVQETFFKALNSIDSFDGKCKMYVWLCQIAKNTYFSHYKKEKRFNAHLDIDSSVYYDNLEENLLRKETVIEAYKSLHSLQEPYKEVFLLRFWGELSFAQIAMLFGKTESWARVTYHRARLKVKEDLL